MSGSPGGNSAGQNSDDESRERMRDDDSGDIHRVRCRYPGNNGICEKHGIGDRQCVGILENLRFAKRGKHRVKIVEVTTYWRCGHCQQVFRETKITRRK